ncbi:MAG: hypothetical protein NZM38_00910 [Cytophagales bacterium]|nr:hypothetical protein [Cytophagales bacterium]MDW8383308.1 hypothetical protein [Flammeovirgaceae bacterium]
MKNLLKPAVIISYVFVVVFVLGSLFAMISGGDSLKNFMADFALRESYVMIILAFGGSLLLPIWANLDNLKTFTTIGIGIGTIVVLFLIGYLISDGSVSEKFKEMGITEATSKTIGASLIMTYVMIFTLLGLIIYGEIVKFFDR